MSHPVHQLVALVQQGKIMEAFEQFYAEDVVMQENASEPTVGKNANRTREEQFVAYVKDVHENRAVTVVADGDNTAIHWNIEFTATDGNRIRYDQVALQEWSSGQVVKERFFYNTGA